MDSKYTASLTDNAKADLREILAYISVTLSNPTAAETFYNQFVESLDRLVLFPDSGSFVFNESIKELNIRKIPVKNYLVYYNVNHRTKDIQILTIFHGRRNIADIIKDLVF